MLTPFKLWIKSAIFSDHRWILFDLQDHEQLEPGEINREAAESLNEKWQSAIDEYWSRCAIAMDWSRRARKVQQDKMRVREMGMTTNIEHVRLALGDLSSTSETA